MTFQELKHSLENLKRQREFAQVQQTPMVNKSKPP